MDQKTLIPFSPAAITHLTYGPSFSLAASQFNEIQTKINSPLKIVTAVMQLLRFIALTSVTYVNASFIAAFWIAILSPMTSTWQEASTAISEWWASKSDDTPLLDIDDDGDGDDDDFDYSDVIGMEITFVTYSDENVSSSSEDKTIEE